MRYIKKLCALLLLLVFAVSCASCAVPAAAVSREPGRMEAHFIDVGQGDSTLIICEGKTMLIDAGDDSQGTAIQNYLQKQGIKKLDYLVLTHPDSDHIGGAPVIITKFDIGQVFMSDYKKDNKTYEKLIKALEYKRLAYQTPKVGSEYALGAASIRILGPAGKYGNPNDASVALMIQNGDNRFLFTGDAQEEAEQDMAETIGDLSADVYHAGHHGSKTSTSEAFFERVRPSCAVISCAEGNSYGHPHAQTLNTFRMNGVKVYRTDEEGTIIAVSDGKEIRFDVPPSETWKAGEPTGSAASGKKGAGGKSGSAQEENGGGPSGGEEPAYILNTKNKKFHRPECDSLPAVNREKSSESRESLISQGYEPCKRCNP